MTPAARFAARSAMVAVVLSLAFATSARAEVTKWDQAKVTELAQQLQVATNDLNDTFRRQPVPSAGSMQSRAFFRLRHQIRSLRRESRSLARALEGGAGHDETLPSFTSLMQTVAAARDEAPRVFSSQDVVQRAEAARAILNQISPYYDASFPQLERVTR